jgi:1-acyl-sn-glycerol-3-phosphate acyltransferase
MLFYLFFKLLFRFEVSGLENIPNKGAVVIASNHLSNWDPPVIGCPLPRMINFMAKEELFKIPVFGWVIRKFKAFPVRRDNADRAAIRAALDILAKGEILGIFPEGTRSKTGQLGDVGQGTAFIIARSGATVVPTALIATNKMFSLKGGFLPKIKVKFGKARTFAPDKADRQTLAQISGVIREEILRLQKESEN